MSVARVLQIDSVPFSDTPAGRMLPVAHSQIEKRFLDGGAVLLSIMDALARLMTTLDRLTGSMDDETTKRNAARILQSAGGLAQLPSLEKTRLDSFQALAEAGGAMRSHVADMTETMRYLRTFAITVKITGAGLAEFSGFAEEIMERIQSGTREVAKFGEALDVMNGQLQNARGFSTEIVGSYSRTVPGIVDDLKHNASTIGDHRQRLVSLAADAASLAKRVQGKIATVLSALQIGDITRQRMEHVQQGFAFLEETALNGALTAGRDISPLYQAVRGNAAVQMEEMAGDFTRESQNVVKTMSSFVDDTRQILALRDAMVNKADGNDGCNFLQTLEASVRSACELVESVRKASSEADEVARSTASTAQRLLAEIEVIRAIKTDIHYMALNTNLRCSRLGEAGKSINVVTSELRLYAARLEASADCVVEQLQALETASRVLSDKACLSFDAPLNEALEAIHVSGAAMETNLAALSAEGDDVFNTVSRSISSLDFEQDLGDLLQRCAGELAALAGNGSADFDGIEDIADVLGGQIFRIYTMASERAIHQEFLPLGGNDAAPAPVTPAGASDEDLFDDALF